MHTQKQFQYDSLPLRKHEKGPFQSIREINKEKYDK